MKLPISWFEEFVEINETPENLAESLLLSGTKVESIEKIGNETVFDFEITPNRPDCLSAIGISREIAAIYNRNLKLPDVSHTQVETKPETILTREEAALCPYITYGVFTNVKLGKSPEWLSKRLELSGIRSINNIVDITNYVMLETGQPMHAFDFEKISGKLQIRKSKKDETITTLDGITRRLPANAIVIEDEKGLIDLAGLMGGERTQVNALTNRILLLVPTYNPILLRKASQELKFRTEASNIFEKHLDPNGHRFAFERASELFRSLAEADIEFIKSLDYPVGNRKIDFPLAGLKNTLGVDFSIDSAAKTLVRLGFSPDKVGASSVMVEVPSFRTDVRESIDLVEEIARISGYNSIEKSLPSGDLPNLQQSNKLYRTIKEQLAFLGMHEIYTSTLASGETIDKAGFSVNETVRVTNRLVVDYEYLRPSLFVGLLTATGLNASHFDSFSLFEVGRIFRSKLRDDLLKNQPIMVSGVFFNKSFSESKGVLEAFLEKLGLTKISFNPSNSKGYPLSADVFVEKEKIGIFVQFSPQVLNNLDIKENVFGFEFEFEYLEKLFITPKYKPLSKYPSIKENLSLFVPRGLAFFDIQKTILESGSGYVASIKLVEDTVIKGKRSILIGIEYRSERKTLASDEISLVREKISKNLRNLNIQVRD